MDRREFLKKAALLIGTSAAGVSLTKLQIATVATGLSGAMGCARNPVGDDPLNKNGNPLLAPCQNYHACDQQNYNCSGPEFVCVEEEFVCKANFKFMCNASKFECSTKFDCSSTEPFECDEFSITHQGLFTIG